MGEHKCSWCTCSGGITLERGPCYLACPPVGLSSRITGSDLHDCSQASHAEVTPEKSQGRSHKEIGN